MSSELQDFFYRHVKIIKDTRATCSECGCRLIGDFSEVAHILPKGRFKSISTNDNNVIYLCGWKWGNNCHAKYDNGSRGDLEKMAIFSHVSKSFDELIEIVEEKITYKDYARWETEYH